MAEQQSFLQASNLQWRSHRDSPSPTKAWTTPQQSKVLESNEEQLQQTDLPEGITLSLNSSGLKGAQLRLLAEAMKLPTKASVSTLVWFSPLQQVLLCDDPALP